VQRLTERD